MLLLLDRAAATDIELIAKGTIDGERHGMLFDPVRNRWDVLGVVELTAVVGYYSMVAMTLNAHDIPLPARIPPELNSAPASRTALPPATRAAAE